jgi:SAM-dependent methyltransferase
MGPLSRAVEAGSREHYEDAVLYDYEYRRRRADVNFYRSLATELLDGPGSVLEMACGSGRITLGLAREGHRVLAMDVAPAMLERARGRMRRAGRVTRDRVSLVRADMRRFAFTRRFPLVVSAFNSLEHLYTRVELAACLACVRDHLEPGGHLVFDVQNPDLRWLSRDPAKRWARTRFTHPGTGERMIYSTNHIYDPVSQVVVIRLYYQRLGADGRPRGRETVVTLSQRKYFPAELEALVTAAGLRVERRFGDFDGEPLEGDSESQVLVCAVR